MTQRAQRPKMKHLCPAVSKHFTGKDKRRASEGQVFVLIESLAQACNGFLLASSCHTVPPNHMVSSSLSFQVLLYLNSSYLAMFGLAELAMAVFKAVNLPYPGGNLALELLLVGLLTCVETTRLWLATKGNLTQRPLTVLVSLALALPSGLAVVYLLLWQTYVLRVEVILCVVQLTLHTLELAFGLLCLAAFCNT